MLLLTHLLHHFLKYILIIYINPDQYLPYHDKTKELQEYVYKKILRNKIIIILILVKLFQLYDQQIKSIPNDFNEFQN